MTATAVAPATAEHATPVRDKRPEIQALRTAAVLGVVLFHLWPGAIRGGYAGVDVFFVISGFLITSHLVREAAKPGGVRLGAFWARRIRRLLPAALLVLVCGAVATYVLVPEALWQQFLRETVAAAFYVENWQLSWAAVDYLAAEDPPSPAQHYWSLSVEEQFYVLWPLLIVAAAFLTRRRAELRLPAIRAIIAAVLVASFAASVLITATDGASAYFVTHTRAWEFAVGGLLAVLPVSLSRAPARWAGPAAAVGWIGLLGALILFRESLPFPGWVALLPVLGTALVIWAGAVRGAGAAVVGNPVVQWVGTVSYSLYLWHWPLVVVVPTTGPVLGTWLREPLILLVTLGLSALSYRFVETPFRTGRVLGTSMRAYLFAIVGMVLVAAVAVPGIVHGRNLVEQSREQANALASGDVACFGASALLESCENPELDGVLLPAPIARKDDTGTAYDCYLTERRTYAADARPQVCHLGSTEPDALRVALVGDSHAASLIPGLSRIAKDSGWSVDVMVANGGGLVAPEAGDERRAYREALLARLTGEEAYDVVLVTQRRSPSLAAGEPDPVVDRLVGAWRPVMKRGTKVVALADNPMVTSEAMTCLDGAESFAEASACEMTRQEAYATSDPLPEAVRRAGAGASLVDLSAAYCTDDRCPLVIGHVLAYRDQTHITATFSKTLAPHLVEAVEESLS
ncbi:Peptidoglycan/LPS O-acetylase OafA/YrhL, contains acyltransferase and SGNH-hydrolase domains [Nocardioides sp. YR527]|uniref:acyltransferase family protein n=1 Tax=Nocardioides sp. YR527 TaxID=1881028 RepID=UPI00088658E4|nr:acyltransferase family protein [Nocardioides sp. YR527]SDK85264.1 Peptidoglycan/LPS O-acetylase OafA/YrhL, contains acyltransferase and SGNH-hydrolase domains [Nocardioides sp. YR527]